MDITLDKTRKLSPINSVTNDTSADDENKIDKEKPLAFLEWVDYTGVGSESPEEYMNEYTQYLKKWSDNNKLSDTETSQVITTRYKAMLKDIALNHTTDDEKRFLLNIDYDNPRHVESALPFFARKLKQLAMYYTQERDNMKQQNTKTKLSGTTLGTSELAYKFVPQLLRRDDLTLKYQNDTVEITTEDIYTNFKVDIDELFDISQEYFKTNNLPVKVDAFVNISKAIEDVLQECKPVLKLSTGASLILNNTSTSTTSEITYDDINDVHLSYFQDYTQRQSSLNIYTETEYIPTLLGSNISFLSGGTLTSVVSTSTPYRNMFNRYGPNVNTESKHDLKSVKELGGYFVPNKLGTLTYYSSKPTYNITSENISTIVPDLNKYGNSPAMNITTIPVEHTEHVEWLKAGTGSGRLKGDIIKDKTLQKFYNYSSTDEIESNTQSGVSRVTDNLGFFDGTRADTWSQPDVYPLEAENIYDIDERQDTMLTEMGTMLTWRTDIYGNEYALFKHISAERSPVATVIDSNEAEEEIVVTCETIDGGETLVKHPDMYGGTEFDIYDGGRHPGLDPKPEQSNLNKPFPDIREQQFDGEKFVLPEHTTAYYGYDPTGVNLSVGRYPITFHGFRRKDNSPAYDRQMYCGLFTDVECGVIFNDLDRCNIADNYVFETFTDIPTGANRISTHAPLERDAFELYTAPGTGDLTTEQSPSYVGFSTWGVSTDNMTVTEGIKLDGDEFTSEACRSLDAEYFYDVDNKIPLFLGETNVSATRRSEHRGELDTSLTIYEQKTQPTGNVIFRTYNSKKIVPLDIALDKVLKYYNFFEGSDFDQIKAAIQSGSIVNFDIIYDVIIIQTRDHLFLEKIQFNPTTSEIVPAGSANVVMRTWDSDPQKEKLTGWFFNEKNNSILTGKTCISNNGVVFIKLYSIDLKDLRYRQVFPNSDYEESSENFSLPEEISTSTITSVDAPIISYNDTRDIYNISFSAQLSGDDMISQAFVCSDYKDQKLNFQLIDTSIHYTDFVPVAETVTSALRKTLKLPGDNLEPEPLTPPVNEHKTFNISMSSIFGEVLSAQSLDLELECTDIPVNFNSYKINEIVVDYGDGQRDNAVRLIDTDITGNVDLTALPDPGDVNDPRINKFNHVYIFNNPAATTITATVSAIYGDFSTYTYRIDIETSPYTLTSGFSGIKMINSKTFTNTVGDDKHVLTIETQNPQHVTDVVLTR